MDIASSRWNLQRHISVHARGGALRPVFLRVASRRGPKVSRRAFGRERRHPISNGYREA
jgi:hypothetical protein